MIPSALYSSSTRGATRNQKLRELPAQDMTQSGWLTAKKSVNQVGRPTLAFSGQLSN